MGWNDSRGVSMSWDGTTPVESFCPGMERLHGGHSILVWNDSRGINSVLEWNDSKGVLLS